MNKIDTKLNYLILGGTGQVGKTLAKTLISFGVSKVIIHGLLKNEVYKTVTELKKHQISNKTKIDATWGNIFSSVVLKDLKLNEIIPNANFRNELIRYLTSTDISGYLIDVVDKFHPDVIINCVNYATFLGYRNTSRKKLLVLQNIELHTNKQNFFTENMLSRGDIYLAKWFDDLYILLKPGKIEYIEVSTTGFGGMGFNLLWTHGEPNQKRASEELISKAMIAGMSHQLLWNLSHTPGVKVHMVIPAALIGWEGIAKEDIHRGGKVLKVSTFNGSIKLRNNLNSIKKLVKTRNEEKKSIFKGIGISTGENGFFGREEFKAITALNQMELITKEEVSNSVIDIIKGNLNKDILNLMDRGSLTPTKNFFKKRNFAINTLNKFNGELSLAYGNLGPYITKLIFELFLLSKCTSSLNEMKEIKLQELIDRLNNIITEKKILSYILSVGIPILYDNGKRLYFPDQPIYPSVDEIKNSKLSTYLVNNWAKVGWIDLRNKNIYGWVNKLSKLIKIIKFSKNSFKVKNININNKIDVGETLAIILTMNGGGRKID